MGLSLREKQWRAIGNTSTYALPRRYGLGAKPYLEMGVGIENIFKVLRVDAIWRLTHREPVIENYPIDRFRVNVSLQLRF